MEAFILDELKKETSLSADQYGGLKGVSANHFLIGTWQTVLESMEDISRAAASILSIDFEKAFNRMGHDACLNALKRLGAKPGTLGLVHARGIPTVLWARIPKILPLGNGVPPSPGPAVVV